eukprot:CAMPEP_0202701318 /NCGR_PEP_ID=MMETSP1385-20130828/14420_1 /ASSEMBLY_ACC=CAM_ASM_000861 /TAXON_ID=933848 /ORGANISM="Elphidium margaritaceum" /LENGTH=594 /DNA_ID=CAMNT_0049358709 /DNA_START=90 /DNA_END=1874 /DNA_ORIENTATION=-
MNGINGSERTFLKVFIAISDDAPNRSLDDHKSSDSDKRSSTKGRQRSSPITSPTSINAQYTIVTISAQSTASDVCAAVARKRNLSCNDFAYELVMCDGDGQASYQKILGPDDKPHQFQQSAAKHGHLGDFHFVFRACSDDADSGSENDTDGDSEPDMFGTLPQQIKHGKYPASYLDKRGKTHRAWRRRYFVLIDNELLYYRRRDMYENHKEPIARIELVNPPGIVKILPPETARKNNTTTITYFNFDIHTPKRVYSLRSDNYKEMVFWVKALSRRNEPNELIDGIDVLVAQSERKHSDYDEALMDRFSTLQSILADKEATDAYLKYLQSQHNEEFIHFWLDVCKYISDFDASDVDRRNAFAAELYEKYIKSGARYELSDVKSEFRRHIQQCLKQKKASKDMFDATRQSVFDTLNRDSFKFFNSSEYFRFIVTYKAPMDESNTYQDMCTWPTQFEQDIDAQNSEKHRYILSSTQNLIHSHSKHASGHHSYRSTMSMIGTHNAHSPVLNRRATHQNGRGHASPAAGVKFAGKSAAKLSLSDTQSSNENTNNTLKRPPPVPQSKPPLPNQLLVTKKKRRPYGQSVFDDAPGLNHNTK